MRFRDGVHFSIARHAAWAPGLDNPEKWSAWAKQSFRIVADNTEPSVRMMPPMQRRRAGFLGKMALEVAYRCLPEQANIPIVFCSRHGEVARSVDLLSDLASGEALSPTSFGLSVHNATAGLFSIARQDTANNIALAAGQSSVEHAVIEACGLLSDGSSSVLLVVYDCPLPTTFSGFEDENAQPYAWAWLMAPATDGAISLTWSSLQQSAPSEAKDDPGGLDIMRFYMRRDRVLERACNKRLWRWSRNV